MDPGDQSVGIGGGRHRLPPSGDACPSSEVASSCTGKNVNYSGVRQLRKGEGNGGSH